MKKRRFPKLFLPLSRKRLILLGVLTLALTLAIPLTTSAVQNFFLGTKRITNVKLGGTQVKQLYMGNKLVWEKTLTHIGTIQSVTYANCPSTASTVNDTRDGHYYIVQKKSDGNCWMLTNLAYGLPDAGTQLLTGVGQDTSTNVPASATAWNRASPPL